MSTRPVWTRSAVEAYATLHELSIESEDFINRLTEMMQKAADAGSRLPRALARTDQPAFIFGTHIFR